MIPQPNCHPERAQRASRKTCGFLCLFLLFTVAVQAQTVLRLSLHDTIQPITADFLQRGLDQAARNHDDAVLLSLGTPRRLARLHPHHGRRHREVSRPRHRLHLPPGSRAGSAGFFLLEAADIAAMAPGTNAGAAHPILEGKTMDPILKEKIENDAAAFLRSYVSRRGRNVEAAETAVRQSKSFSDTEALQLHLIDLTAPDDRTLLNTLNGRIIKRFYGTSTILRLKNARIVDFAPSTRERLLTRLTNPDLAVLLLVLGGLLVYLEFNVPGTIVPGALGTLMILLALFGLNLLPIRHTAVLLLVAALVLILLELKFASHGVLALTGTLALVFGFATLVDAPIPEMRVHLGTALATGIGFGAISFTLAALALRARRSKHLLGPQALLGAPAIARTALSPTGQIEVRGEFWFATLGTNADALPAGASVRVRAVDGLLLFVEASKVN